MISTDKLRIILMAIHRRDLDVVMEHIKTLEEVTENFFKTNLIYGSVEIFKYFLSLGFDMSKTTYNCLFTACGKMDHDPAIVDFILINKLVPTTPKWLEDCLYNASLQQNIQIMQLLLLEGAVPSVEIGCNAVKLNNGTMLKLLVDYGLNLDIKNPNNAPDFSVKRMAEYYGVDINALLS